MFTVSIIIGLILGLAVALTVMYMRVDTRSIPGHKHYESRLRQLGIPIGIAAVVSVLAWAGLSIMFAPGEPEKNTVMNSVSQSIPAENTLSPPTSGQPTQSEDIATNLSGPTATAAESILSRAARQTSTDFPSGDWFGARLAPPGPKKSRFGQPRRAESTKRPVGSKQAALCAAPNRGPSENDGRIPGG